MQLVAEDRDRLPAHAGPAYKLGRYITSVTCAECHGPRLEGTDEPEKVPDLIVVGSYSRTEFERLITTGVPVATASSMR